MYRQGRPPTRSGGDHVARWKNATASRGGAVTLQMALPSGNARTGANPGGGVVGSGGLTPTSA